MKKKNETMPNCKSVKVLRLHKESIRLLEENDSVHVVGGTNTRVTYCDTPSGHCCFPN
jgi:hypothetical protein